MEQVRKRLEKTIQELLETSGYELVASEISGKKNNICVRCYVDSSRGITVGECARLNGLLEEPVEQECLKNDAVLGRLEVSSPGLDRPLKTRKDFIRNIGREVRIIYEGEEGKTECTGEITAVDPESLHLSVQGRELDIPLGSVSSAKVQTRW